MSVKSKSAEASADQEIIVTRLINAPRELVFAAFKDQNHISQWWGPNGFKTTTYEMDVRRAGSGCLRCMGRTAPIIRTASGTPR